MKRLFFHLPFITPFLLIVLFMKPLFVSFEFSYENKPSDIEIIIDGEKGLEQPETKSILIQKGILYRLHTLQEFFNELNTFQAPQDGFPESIQNQITRIIFSQKLLISFIAFLVLLCLTSFFSLKARAWFAYPLGKTLHWAGYVYILILIFHSFPHVPWNLFSAIITVLYIIIFILLITSNKALQRLRKELTRFEILKYNPEFDEEGRKQAHTSKTDPVVISYHFGIIILVGLLVGNLIYIPLFVLQKNFSSEFGILIAGLLILLSIFYIRNYKKIAYDPELSKNMNVLASISFLQYRFIRNLTVGVGILFIVIIFVTILFSILLLNSDLLNYPQLGINDKNIKF